MRKPLVSLILMALAVAGGPAFAATPGATRWVSLFGEQRSSAHAVDVTVSRTGETVFVVGTERPVAGGQIDIATVAYDTSTGSERWAARFDGAAHANDRPYAIEVSPTGSPLVVVGTTDDGLNGDDVAVIAIDAVSGARLWTRRFNGHAGAGDTGAVVDFSPQGDVVFVAGTARDGSRHGTDFLVAAIETNTGETVWRSAYDRSTVHHVRDDGACDLAVSPDGSTVFVTGSTSRNTHDRLFETVAFDTSTGVVRWQRHGPATPHHEDVWTIDVPYAIAVSPDGTKIAVTGSSLLSYEMVSRSGYRTVAYSASNGEPLWGKRQVAYDDEPAFGPGTDIVFTPDGQHLVATGGVVHATWRTDSALAARAYSADGVQQWWQRFEAGTYASATSSAIDAAPDSRALFIAGTSERRSGQREIVIVAYQADNGSPLWTSLYAGPGGYTAVGAAVAVAPDGATVFVVGSEQEEAGKWRFATLAIDT